MLNDTVFLCTGGTVANNPTDCPGGSYTGTESQSVSVRDCPTQCNNTDLAAATADVNNRLKDLEQLLGALNELIPLLSCEFIATAFDNAQEQLCVDFTYEPWIALMFFTSCVLTLSSFLFSPFYFLVELCHKFGLVMPSKPQAWSWEVSYSSMLFVDLSPRKAEKADTVVMTCR